MYLNDLVISELEQLTLLRNHGLLTDEEMRDVEENMREGAHRPSSKGTIIINESQYAKVGTDEEDKLLILTILFIVAMALIAIFVD